MRMQARDAELALVTTRLAAWGDEQALGRFLDGLHGRPSERQDKNDPEIDAALAAFGLRRE